MTDQTRKERLLAKAAEAREYYLEAADRKGGDPSANSWILELRQTWEILKKAAEDAD